MPEYLLVPPITLPNALPACLPEPKFQIGSVVSWTYVSNPDFGCVVGIVYTSEASTKAIGFHYAVLLDINSPSRSYGVLFDWGFEQDLQPHTGSVLPL